MSTITIAVPDPLDAVLVGRMAGPFVPLAPDWKECVCQAAAERKVSPATIERADANGLPCAP